MMNVLFISHGGRRNGGAQNVLYNLIRDLPRDQFNIHCIFPEGGQFADQVKALGVTPHIVKFKWWAGFEIDTLYKITDFCLNVRTSTDAVAKIIKDNAIDIVVSNTITMVEGAFAAQLCKVPHIWYVHEILSRDPKLKHLMRLELLYPLMVNLSRFVVVVSEAVKKEFIEHIKWAEKERLYIKGDNSGPIFDTSKIQVIYNGVDIPEIGDHKRPHSHNIVSVGGICRRKGQLDLLNAAMKVVLHYPDAHFYMAGSFWERGYRHELLEKRVELGLEKNWSFLKWVEDMPTFYKGAAIMVSPSHCESFGLSLLEAMSYKLPVVTTDSGGPSEIVVDDLTGIVVPVNHDLPLADAILFLLENPHTADKMGEVGRQRVIDNFQQSFSVKKFINLLVEGVKK
jgi:glycosyltransferase involved in cell wall biosynthesis